MSTCKEPCEKPGHIDLRLHHTIPDVQPPLPGLPQKDRLPSWPPIIRDGVAAVSWDHCESCGAPVPRFPDDPIELFCSEC
jgi:hypothetical protein